MYGLARATLCMFQVTGLTTYVWLGLRTFVWLSKNNTVFQVIGLTASVGVGKNSTVYGAREHILKLCANLNCKIVQVKRETESLNKYVNTPVQSKPSFEYSRLSISRTHIIRILS